MMYATSVRANRWATARPTPAGAPVMTMILGLPDLCLGGSFQERAGFLDAVLQGEQMLVPAHARQEGRLELADRQLFAAERRAGGEAMQPTVHHQLPFDGCKRAHAGGWSGGRKRMSGKATLPRRGCTLSYRCRKGCFSSHHPRSMTSAWMAVSVAGKLVDR